MKASEGIARRPHQVGQGSNFPAQLRSGLKEAALERAQIQDLFGVTPNYLDRWKRGECLPSPPVQSRVLSILETRIAARNGTSLLKIEPA